MATGRDGRHVLFFADTTAAATADAVLVVARLTVDLVDVDRADVSELDGGFVTLRLEMFVVAGLGITLHFLRCGCQCQVAVGCGGGEGCGCLQHCQANETFFHGTLLTLGRTK